ncbi:hypothetical protein AVEN_273643-1 [Araneus ventricosus]|uniref:Uncharacterized protein n=1 Tax=Araneus ventricosus TaxID=182803 RepID=A0A4Y2AVK3_ARAVE|nr:hypothetical protein AVEN_273643-1 [Araneus ventricosus]
MARTTLGLQIFAPRQLVNVRPSTYDLTCNGAAARRSFSGIGFRTSSPPLPKPRLCNSTAAPQLFDVDHLNMNGHDSNGFL